MPHSLALFCLAPYNIQAKSVIAHPNNRHLVSPLDSGAYVLDIGQFRSMSGSTTLATLGRNGDVYLEGSTVSKIQCSFEIEPNGFKRVMIHDRSSNHTTQVFGQGAMHFEHGRPRVASVTRDVVTVIGMGGRGRDFIQFRLIWPRDPAATRELIEKRDIAKLEPNPRLPWTLSSQDKLYLDLVSSHTHLQHKPGCRLYQKEYKIGDTLGAGQFGAVHKAIEQGSGKLMAVKILKLPSVTSGDFGRFYEALGREVKHLSRINHPHIVDFIATQDLDGPTPKIFLGLKEGTLTALIARGCSVPKEDLASTVIHHMLQALDYLAAKDIVHRDVKPDNILYVSKPGGQYHFVLGDFGLSNHVITAETVAGSLTFMAPEVFQGGKQTHKLDVWSLYVTIVWTLDIDGFREVSKGFRSFDAIRNGVLLIASKQNRVGKISEMARINPEERASAAQMLDKCFNGVGRSTPPVSIPAIGTIPPPGGFGLPFPPFPMSLWQPDPKRPDPWVGTREDPLPWHLRPFR